MWTFNIQCITMMLSIRLKLVASYYKLQFLLIFHATEWKCFRIWLQIWVKLIARGNWLLLHKITISLRISKFQYNRKLIFFFKCQSLFTLLFPNCQTLIFPNCQIHTKQKEDKNYHYAREVNNWWNTGVNSGLLICICFLVGV